MNKFINRENELSGLERHYSQPGSRMVIVYGRRRLGKTTLLKKFCAGRKHAYYLADLGAEADQRRGLAATLARALDEPVLESSEYASWYDLFAAFDRLRPPGRKFILVFDEYQNLPRMQRGFSSFIQKWWDEHWKEQNLFLVLCGSVTSMMYEQTLAQSSPLYGRSAGQVLLGPMDFSCMPGLLPRAGKDELVRLYGLTGGVPRYAELAGSYRTFEQALRALVLDPYGALYNEARYLLRDEIQRPNICWSILQVLAGGPTRISEVASRLQMPANKLTRYMDLLRDLRLVRREVPILQKNPERSKKGLYEVADPFMRLWFNLVAPHESMVEFGEVKALLQRCASRIERHISGCFEDICRNYMRGRISNFNCIRLGRQWGKGYEIDIAGVDESQNLSVLGECKWSQSKVGLSVLRELQDKVKAWNLPVAPALQWVLFSRSGFTRDLRKHAREEEHVHLFGIDDLLVRT